MFGSHFSPCAFSSQAQNRKKYHCYRCRRYFLTVVPLESDWCPQCPLCGSTFVEEFPQVGQVVHHLPGENMETRSFHSSLDDMGREYSGASVLDWLPVAPSMGSSSVFHATSATRENPSFQSYRLRRSTASSSGTENSSTWQHVLERLWDVFSRLRSSLREPTNSRPPTSAHTTTTAAATSSSSSSATTQYTTSIASEGADSFQTGRVPTFRRVRRRTTGDHMQVANNLLVEEIWEREFATLYQQLMFTQNDPEEYARMQTFLSSMLDCLFELYSQKSSPTCKSFVDSLEGQLLTEKEAKEAESCAICWEEFHPNTLVVFLPCSHLFCKQCICTWLKQNSTCPTCRYQLPVDES